MIYLYHGTDEVVSLARVLSASMTCCAKSEALNVRFDGVRRNMDQPLRPLCQRRSRALRLRTKWRGE